MTVVLHVQDASEEFLLELVTVLHVGARPESRDELRERLLGGQMPRMPEHPSAAGNRSASFMYPV